MLCVSIIVGELIVCYRGRQQESYRQQHSHHKGHDGGNEHGLAIAYRTPPDNPQCFLRQTPKGRPTMGRVGVSQNKAQDTRHGRCDAPSRQFPVGFEEFELQQCANGRGDQYEGNGDQKGPPRVQEFKVQIGSQKPVDIQSTVGRCGKVRKQQERCRRCRCDKRREAQAQTQERRHVIESEQKDLKFGHGSYVVDAFCHGKESHQRCCRNENGRKLGALKVVDGGSVDGRIQGCQAGR